MSIQIIPQLGDTATQFGAGAAKGLAEQVPKEVERYRTASGLEALGKEDLSKLNQFQAMAKLSKIPGLTPEMMGLALGEFSRQRGLQAAKQRAQSFQQGNGQSQQSGNAGEKLNPNYGIPASEQELNQKTIDVMESTNKDYDQAYTFVTQQDQQRVAREQGEEIRANLARQKFDDTLETFLQKKGNETYKDIVGELQVDYRNQLRSAIDRGENPTKEATRLAKDLLDFAKVKNKMRENATVRSIFQPQKTRIALEVGKKEFEKRGRSEDFKNFLISEYGLSPELASEMTYPVNSNKETFNELNKLERKGYFSKKQNPELIANNLKKTIKTNKDSILSIAKFLNEKERGLGNKVMEILGKDESFMNSMSNWQTLEFQTVPSPTPYLGDIFLSSFGLYHKKYK